MGCYKHLTVTRILCAVLSLLLLVSLFLPFLTEKEDVSIILSYSFADYLDDISFDQLHQISLITMLKINDAWQTEIRSSSAGLRIREQSDLLNEIKMLIILIFIIVIVLLIASIFQKPIAIWPLCGALLVITSRLKHNCFSLQELSESFYQMGLGYTLLILIPIAISVAAVGLLQAKRAANAEQKKKTAQTQTQNESEQGVSQACCQTAEAQECAIRCSACGRQSNGKYCGFCGAKTVPISDSSKTGKSSNKRKKKALRICVMIIALLALGIVLFSVLWNPKGCATPEKAALCFMEGTLNFDYEKTFRAVYPETCATGKRVKEDFAEAKIWIEEEQIVYSSIEVVSTKNANEKAPHYQACYALEFKQSVKIEQVKTVTVGFSRSRQRSSGYKPSYWTYRIEDCCMHYSFGANHPLGYLECEVDVVEVDGKWYAVNVNDYEYP